MPDDLAALNGRPRLTLRVDGEAYAIWPLTFDELGQLQQWVDAQYRDPVELAMAKLGRGLTVTQEQFLLRIALEVAARPRPLIGTPEADVLLRSAEGSKQMLELSIRKGRPDFDAGAADALFGKISPLDVARAFDASGLEAVMSDPKASSGPGQPTTPGPADVEAGSTGGASTTA